MTRARRQPDATEAILEARKKTHGEYAEHARCTQSILRALQAERNWDGLPDVVRETLHMIAHKLGRIVTGSPFLHDHYADVCGYAQLVVQRTVDGVGLRPEVEALLGGTQQPEVEPELPTREESLARNREKREREWNEKLTREKQASLARSESAAQQQDGAGTSDSGVVGWGRLAMLRAVGTERVVSHVVFARGLGGEPGYLTVPHERLGRAQARLLDVLRAVEREYLDHRDLFAIAAASAYMLELPSEEPRLAVTTDLVAALKSLALAA